MSKMCHLNLEIQHVKGQENSAVDFLSCYQVDNVEANVEEVVMNYSFPRMVCRMQTRGDALSVPEDIKMINEAAKKSDVYQKMIKAVRGEWDIKDPAVQEINSKAEFSIDDFKGEETCRETTSWCHLQRSDLNSCALHMMHISQTTQCG